MKLSPIICAISLTLGLAANAQGVKDKKRWDKANEQVETVRLEAAETCGTDLAFSFEKESFGSDLGKLDDVGMDGYCGDAFSAMSDLCEDEDYREAMKPIQSMSCAFDESLTKPDVSLADGKLSFTFNWDTANHERVVKEFLQDTVKNGEGNEVQDQKRWEEATNQIETVRSEAEEICGTDLAFSFDEESFGSDLGKLDDVGMDGYCGDAFSAMSDVCEDEDYRAAMTSVKSLSCAFDESLEKPSVSLVDGKLRFSFNWDTANHEQIVKNYLEDNL